MEYEQWIRLDNASNIFLAARNEIDTKVFRLTAEMKDNIKPSILQEALNITYEEYPLFHSVLRRGFFWYYLEKSEEDPQVEKESEPPVSKIYKSGERNFLFRILYKENRIHLEVFHALTDGTGALWFLEDLLIEYVRLRYAKDEQNPKEKRQKADIEDSFNRYFREKKRRTQFDRFIQPLREIYKEQKINKRLLPSVTESPEDKKIYQIKGTLTPDHRPRIIHLELPVKEALALARKEGVSLTMYLSALYLLTIYEAKEKKDEEITLSMSIPINLRQFFPSITVRNFFSTTVVDYTFKADKTPELSDICQKINQQFQKQLEKEALENRLKKHIAFEFYPPARIILRPIKDLILKGINKLNNRKITAAMSNLGIVHLPEEMSEYVENMYFLTSVIRPQFSVLSYGQTLNICFTSPFSETAIYQHFVEHLTAAGLKVAVDVNKVTREELEE
jgi:NRPS condensation-like uncharacterized protein